MVVLVIKYLAEAVPAGGLSQMLSHQRKGLRAPECAGMDTRLC